jgi:hypothetical protein
MKHLNDYINESILDTDEIQGNTDKNVVLAWIKRVTPPRFNVDQHVTVSDDGVISCDRWLPLWIYDGETIPDGIKCDVENMTIELDADTIIPKDFLPDKLDHLEIRATDIKKLEFKATNLEIRICDVAGVKDITFPKNFKCEELSLIECSSLGKVKNISKVEKIKYPK